VLVAAACDSPYGDASFSNTVDTVTVYALRGTAIRLPSAYSLLDLAAVRTDITTGFDFAFDIDSVGNPLLYPAGALGLSTEPGLLLTDKTFDDIHEAPGEGYASDSALALRVDAVFVGRSRSSSSLCSSVGSALPMYGKFHVLAIDPVERSLTFEALVNLNCGFRSLEFGVPTS
jgi:hypothetical protein